MGRTPSDRDYEDTLLWRLARNWAASCSSAAQALGARVGIEEEVIIADLQRPGGFYSGAHLLRPLTGERTARVMDRIEAATEGGRGEFLLWSPWPTPDLSERGWHLYGHPTALLLPPGAGLVERPGPDGRRQPGTAADAGPDSDPDIGPDISEVRDAEALAAAERVVVEGFPLEDLLPFEPGRLFRPSLLDSGNRLWLARRDGAPVGVGGLFVGHGVAQLSLGATLPEVRRRGYWAALVRTRLAAAEGMPVVTIASDMSRPGFEVMGFQPFTRLTCWGLRRPD